MSSGSYVKVLRVNYYGSLLLLRYKAQESLSFDGRVRFLTKIASKRLFDSGHFLAIKFFEMSP